MNPALLAQWQRLIFPPEGLLEQGGRWEPTPARKRHKGLFE